MIPAKKRLQQTNFNSAFFARYLDTHLAEVSFSSVSEGPASKACNPLPPSETWCCLWQCFGHDASSNPARSHRFNLTIATPWSPTLATSPASWKLPARSTKRALASLHSSGLLLVEPRWPPMQHGPAPWELWSSGFCSSLWKRKIRHQVFLKILWFAPTHFQYGSVRRVLLAQKTLGSNWISASWYLHCGHHKCLAPGPAFKASTWFLNSWGKGCKDAERHVHPLFLHLHSKERFVRESTR